MVFLIAAGALMIALLTGLSSSLRLPINTA